MKYRKLRIAWSVAWGVVAVLLCVLWVRSYISTGTTFYVHSRGYSFDSDELLRVPPNSYLSGIVSQSGLVSVGYTPNYDLFNASISNGETNTPVISLLGISIVRSPGGGGSVNLPHWSLLLLFAGIAVAAWLHWSNCFSLRTLLIAMTLVALALGLIVWASR